MKSMRMMKNTEQKNSRRGSYTVETAIFLPIFILAVLTIGYVVRIIGTCENVNFAVTDELAYVAARAYADKVPAGFTGNLKSRIEEENPGAENIKVSSFRYLYSDGQNESLISVKIDYKARIRLPLNFSDGINVSSKYLTRGFTGSRSSNPNMPFSEMEKDKNADIVWIFPDSGEKYHSEDCRYVNPYPTKTVLSDSIRDRYSPCPICDSENMKTGSVVFVFTNSGSSYHRGDCKTIDKYVVRIDRSEAEEKGYAPCSVCGGG